MVADYKCFVLIFTLATQASIFVSITFHGTHVDAQSPRAFNFFISTGLYSKIIFNHHFQFFYENSNFFSDTSVIVGFSEVLYPGVRDRGPSIYGLHRNVPL